MKAWLVTTVLALIPSEQVAAIMLNRALDYSRNRSRARFALQICRRILEAARAATAALETLLDDEVTEQSVDEFQDSVERAAIKAWSKGEPTPPQARHLKEREDAAT